MHTIYALARFFPYWALPVMFILLETGTFFRRRRQPAQYYCWAGMGMLAILTVLWFVFRGDLNSDRWIRSLLG